MQTRVMGLFAGSLVLASCATAPRGQVAWPACDVLLSQATVVDPATRREGRGDVALGDGHIIAVGAVGALAAGRCARTVDLAGRWLIPGLVDLHVHSWGNPAPTSDEAHDDADQDIGTEAVTRLVLKAGVTALLDLGGAENERLGDRDRLRASLAAGGEPHAEFFAAGPVFVERRHRTPGPRARRATRFGGGARVVDGPSDARAQVRELAARRPDVIKIIYSHEGGRGSMSRATMQAIVAEARALKLKTVVHIGTWTDAREAIEAGATAVTHLYDDELIPADLPALYAAHGTFSIPTMAVQCDFDRIKNGSLGLGDGLLAQVATPKLLAAYRDRTHYTERALDWADWQSEYCVAHDLPSLKALDAAGVGVGAGSDSGNLGVFEGYSLHREMQLMVEAGLSSWTALASATTAAGAFLGQRYGVQAGDVANLVALDGDPIADIRNTERIAHVWVAGRLVF